MIMREIEKLAKEINTIVEKKVKKGDLDITKDLDNMILKVNGLKPSLTEQVEINFANYLIDKCEEFKISIDKRHKFSFE